MSRGYELISADFTAWARDYKGERFQAILSDPPYALLSIGKRFKKDGAAKANTPLFNRVSKGFLGKEWDSFQGYEQYREWITEWASLLIENVLHPGSLALFFGGTRTWHHLALGLEAAGFEIFDTLIWIYGEGFPKGLMTSEGYYSPSALKPAWEPILLCAAPRQGNTYAHLAEHFGTGMLNIDGARITADDTYRINAFNDGMKPFGGGAGKAYTSRNENKGRWPANLIIDEVTALGIDRQSGNRAGCKTPSDAKGESLFRPEQGAYQRQGPIYPDSGGASRYFYCAKAKRSEKMEYNDHPTVKPHALCKHLATLIKPPSPKRLLVPFSGSGSEMIAAMDAGWEFVTGVEKEEEYIEITERRMSDTYGFFKPERLKR